MTAIIIVILLVLNIEAGFGLLGAGMLTFRLNSYNQKLHPYSGWM